MHLGITTKLILTLVIGSALLVGLVALANSWSFQRGFLDYLHQVELQQVRPIAEEIGRDYSEYGDWSFLKFQQQRWQDYLKHLPGPRNASSQTRSNAPPGFAPGQLRPRPLQRDHGDRLSLRNRLYVTDSEENHIIGPQPIVNDKPNKLAMRHQGVIVGWLNLRILPVANKGLEAAFRQRQLWSLTYSALAGLMLFVLIAIALGRYLLRPINDLVIGIRHLSEGDYSHRIEHQVRDELGSLTDSYNRLAMIMQRNEELRRAGMADVSHELRTPLAVLQSEIEAMQDGIRPCDQARLASLHNQVDGLSRLVNDLYELALTDAGGLVLTKVPTDIPALIGSCIQDTETLFSEKKIDIQESIESGLITQADEPRLKQVLIHLLKNSSRYTDSNGAVAITANSSKHKIVVRIEDSGPGVSDEQLALIFERFYRVEASRSRDKGGAGLGLAISRNIIQLHGGSMQATHARVGGLCITIELAVHSGL